MVDYNHIRDLTLTKHTWRIKCRVTRMWDVYVINGKYVRIALVLLDGNVFLSRSSLILISVLIIRYIFCITLLLIVCSLIIFMR